MYVEDLDPSLNAHLDLNKSIIYILLLTHINIIILKRFRWNVNIKSSMLSVG